MITFSLLLLLEGLGGLAERDWEEGGGVGEGEGDLELELSLSLVPPSCFTISCLPDLVLLIFIFRLLSQSAAS